MAAIICLSGRHGVAICGAMIQPPETVYTDSRRVKCDGATDIRGGATLGHPRIWMEIDENGFVDCGYCDRRFVLKGGPADRGIHEMSPGDLPTA